MDEEKQIRERLNDGVKVFDWARWISVGIGAWPLSSNTYLFDLALLYFTGILVLEYSDLFVHINDLAAVMENLLENIALNAVYAALFSLRLYKKQLAPIFEEIIMDYNSADAIKNINESDMFMVYSNNAKFFAKYIIISIMLTNSLWLIQPMLYVLTTTDSTIDSENKTSLFVLPYHFHIFYKMENFNIYLLTYAWQSPYTVINSLGMSSFNVFLLIFVFHISGRLAILTLRIEKLTFEKNPHDQLNGIIIEHIRLLELVKKVSDIFASPLLIFFILSNAILCICLYQILLNFIMGPDTQIFQYITLLIAAYLIIFVFCMNGELLLEEGNKVSQALSNCNGSNISNNCMKKILYSLLRSQKPLTLRAGKFKTFNYATLTDISKTAAGYLSILRKFI